MRRLSGSDILLIALGLLLLTAAVLKGHELLTVPVANKDFGSWRPFLIFQVEFELALGIWLLSGVFKRSAWLAALAHFGRFCCVILYKGITGVTSCGCFGRVHINPWIMLIAIDLPTMIALTRDLTGNGDFLRFAQIEVPPYGPKPAPRNSPGVVGPRADRREWFAAAPALIPLNEEHLQESRDQELLDLRTILPKMDHTITTIMDHHAQDGVAAECGDARDQGIEVEKHGLSPSK